MTSLAYVLSVLLNSMGCIAWVHRNSSHWVAKTTSCLHDLSHWGQQRARASFPITLCTCMSIVLVSCLCIQQSGVGSFILPSERKIIRKAKALITSICSLMRKKMACLLPCQATATATATVDENTLLSTTRQVDTVMLVVVVTVLNSAKTFLFESSRSIS